MDDNTPKLNIWSMQNRDKMDMLEVVLQPEDLKRTVAVLMLDLDNPLDLMQ